MRETQGRTRAAWDSPTAELEKCVDAQLCSGSDQKWPGTVWHPETMGHITAAAASERIPRLLWQDSGTVCTSLSRLSFMNFLLYFSPLPSFFSRSSRNVASEARLSSALANFSLVFLVSFIKSYFNSKISVLFSKASFGSFTHSSSFN